MMDHAGPWFFGAFIRKGIREVTSKERVMVAMTHQRADRTPINFRATDEIIQRLVRYFNTDYFGILHHFRVDFREIIPPYVGPRHPKLRDGSDVDMWGVGRKEVIGETGRDVLISFSPLQDAETVEEMADYAWPQADWYDFSAVRPMVLEYRDFALSTPGIHIEGYHGVFHTLTYLFGMEKTMMLLVTEPDVIRAAIDRIMKFFRDYYNRLFEAAGGSMDFLFYKDDFGAQNNLLIGRQMFMEFFYPNLKTLAELAESYNARLFLHSCGSVVKLIPDFLDAGVAVLDPIQVTASGMDIRLLKEQFGDRLSFHGGIDVQQLMPFGTVEEVKAKAEETIEVLGNGGGYFFSPSHRFQRDTPLQNILALYGVALAR